jgi:TonB family protein
MWAGFLLVALLINALSLSKASEALGESLREAEEPVEPDVSEFEMVEEQEEEPTSVEPQFAEGRRPSGNANPEDETSAPIRPHRVSNRPQADPEPESEPEVAGEQDSEPDIHEAPDGELTKLGVPQLGQLGGSKGALKAALGDHAARPDPHDVDEGAADVLRAKQNLYGSFFNRLADRVSEHWEPERANKAVDPNQTRFGTSTRTTGLWVQLDQQGAITKIVVKKSSGADHLDEEAIRALKAAAPFPNPPEDLVDSNGNIEFDFGFTLDFVDGGRIFRRGK